MGNSQSANDAFKQYQEEREREQARKKANGHAADEPTPRAPPEEQWAKIREELSFGSILARPIPPQQRLLGDLLTTTTRMFISGFTGLGKRYSASQAPSVVQ